MGTTIRREPVNFDIPNAPAYKFLNITNFRGLDVSSNPFELATNTASDCLNVYVDETNTLTTRPRLEKKLSTPTDGEHIGTYNLHNGYLLHYLVDGVGVMKMLVNNSLTLVSGTIPITKCKYFEQGDKIYLLDGNRYMVVSDNVLSDVEGYVPTTSVVDAANIRHTVESLNLLSAQYDEKYVWDGLTTIPYDKKDTLLDYSYTKIEILDENGNNFIDEFTFLYAIYPDNSLLIGKNNGEIYYIDIKNNKPTIIYTGVVATDKAIRCATDNKTFWVSYLTGTTRYYQYYWFNEETLQWDYDSVKTFTEVTSPKEIATDNTGTYLLLLNSGNNNSWLIERIDSTTYNKKNIGYTAASNDSYVKIIMHATRTFVNFVILSTETSQSAAKDIYTKVAEIYRGDIQELMGNRDVGLSTITSVNINETNEHIYFTGQRTTDLKWSISETSFVQGEPNVSAFVRTNSSFGISSNGAYAWFAPEFSGNDSTMSINLYKNPQTDFEKIQLFKQTFVAKRLFYKPRAYILAISSHSGGELWLWNNTIEPNVAIRKTIEDDEEWSEKRNMLLNSKLMTRFDNNYWFASNNTYYRSANNDPTYFPITEYNDLGDINEEITGFNLANDTTLIAYKKNRVYLIQPFTSSLDTTEYTITESKNTVGNTAIGAPIVTTLTEIPLQINNDGVYGLSQLSNVSSTERIADLMSEPINERWLNINDELIRNTQTLNRLYWTYIILPDETQDKTMIYLLDNRSNSWYYWELPIIVSDSFIKDNKVEFVDINGNIYYLTTADIIDINYDDEKVTKYYDEGGRLIPWFWQSQVLPMGTMNYSKRLVNTTFILTDTDDSDGYGLQYNFKVFRKLANSTPEKEISDKLTLVRSTTKKTNISKFGFLQMRISNLTKESRDYEAYENNKLRLVGLGLKYVLLEGLIR